MLHSVAITIADFPLTWSSWRGEFRLRDLKRTASAVLASASEGGEGEIRTRGGLAAAAV